ncbi:MAG: LysM peptidoglycan-binding domain-containing protein [Firmicutes bacterium]|nr:LysM peptidoglycan-binding domain-containing protein [Bacillota bacterium]
MTIHVVKAGETLFSIGREYNMSATYIQNINQLPNPNNLVVGQAIIIAKPAVSYVAKSGDDLWGISQRYGVSLTVILRNNPYLLTRVLVPGDVVVIEFEDVHLGAAKVNGYVYDTVNVTYLKSVLPYLTYISVFTYGIRRDGTLIEANDEEIISLARLSGVAPLLHLSTLDESGVFSTALAGTILNSSALQDIVIENILTILEKKKYYGLDIDFEYIPVSDRQNYVNFISKLTTRLNARGYIVIAALAPKVSANQPGTLYEGHDYFGIGAAANYAFIMTYEWGYTYGPPMAVAPLNKVKEVLDYAVTEIPADQVLMGVPTYGYLWTLPFVRGQSRAVSLSNILAVEIAAENGVEIKYDEKAQSPFYNFTDVNGTLCEVWFEDARSVEAKLRLINEYGLAGAGYWNMDRPFPQNLMMLNLLYEIIQETIA